MMQSGGHPGHHQVQTGEDYLLLSCQFPVEFIISVCRSRKLSCVDGYL